MVARDAHIGFVAQQITSLMVSPSPVLSAALPAALDEREREVQLQRLL